MHRFYKVRLRKKLTIFRRQLVLVMCADTSALGMRKQPDLLDLVLNVFLVYYLILLCAANVLV